MRFPLGEMTIGDVLDRGLKLLFARLPVFYAIELIVLSPLLAVQIAAPLLIGGGNVLDPAMIAATLGVGLLGLFIALVLRPIATAAVLYIVMEEYAGRRPSMSDALAFAVSRFFPLLFASILVGLIVVVGTLLCCVPGIYLWVTYAFVGQIVVLEKLGIGESFQRSQNLVEGYRWRVFGVLFLITIANTVIQGALGGVLGAVLPTQEVIPIQGGIRAEVNPVNHIVVTLITSLVSILFATYLAVCTTLLYLDLRIRKEGFDLELAAGDERPRARDDDDDDDDRDERDRDERDHDDRYDDDRPRNDRDDRR